MAKIKFREIKMSKANKQRLEVINGIIEEYQAQDYVLTLRQLYYQLVSRDIIPNALAEYAKLSGLLKEGRMAGIVDWDAIEDRLRKPSSPASFEGPEEILDAAIGQYMLPRQKGQKTYVEVWVEKDALSGVLSRVTRKYHVPILVNRGYSSASAMYDSYERFSNAMDDGKDVKILYLGDYDPSGIDMIRDIRDRISEFLRGSDDIENMFNAQTDSDEYQNWIDEVDDADVIDTPEKTAAGNWAVSRFNVESIALTRAQITQYNPPPNPAKKTDPRAKDFIKKHGATSWEVDALKPEVLNALLESNILKHIDEKVYKAVVSREAADIKKLKSLKNYL